MGGAGGFHANRCGSHIVDAPHHLGTVRGAQQSAAEGVVWGE